MLLLARASARMLLLQDVDLSTLVIFCDNPWQNEPGRENIPNSQEHNKRYNRTLYPHTVEHGMLDWLERRTHPSIRGAGRFGTRFVEKTSGSVIDIEPSIWDEIVKRHFDDNAEDIVSTVSKWVNDVGPPPTPARRSYVAPGGFNPATAGFPFGGGSGLSPSNHPSMYGAAVYPFAGDGYMLPAGNYGPAPGANAFPHGSSPLNSSGFGAQQPSGPPLPSSGAIVGNGEYRALQPAAPAQPPAYGTTASTSQPPPTDMSRMYSAALADARNRERISPGPWRERQTSEQGATNRASSTTLTGDNLVQKLRDAVQKLKRNPIGFMH